MRIPILLKVEDSDLYSFISFWSKLYSYNPGMEHLYKKAIVKRQYDENDIQDLFTWKNGMKLSRGKQTSLDTKALSKLRVINTLKTGDNFRVADFLEAFRNLSVVWKIFLLHTLNPNIYPIYDQHIHRAYNFIHGLPYKQGEVKVLMGKEKEAFYFDEYLAFVATIENISLKTMDEAFFAFGQFLKIKDYAKLVQ